MVHSLTTKRDADGTFVISRPVENLGFFKGESTLPELRILFGQYIMELAQVSNGDCRSLSKLRLKYQTSVDAITLFPTAPTPL